MPVLLGIPWLAGILGSLFAGLITFFVQFMSKKLALTAAFVTASLALFSVFFGVCWSLMQSIMIAAPPEVSMGVHFLLPSNAPTCMGAYLTARVARWVYDWNTRVIQFRLNL